MVPVHTVRLSLSVFVFPRLSRTCTLVAHVHASRPAPSLAPFPSTNASLQHQPQQYKASLMRTVIMMLIKSSSLMVPWVLSTSASPWSKHTVSSKYLREEVEMVFLGHSAQHAPVHL